jgi:hypothetical protein
MLAGLSFIHLFWLVVIAAMWIVPIAVVVYVVQHVRRAGQQDPRATLAERLHRGEITREEFDVAMRAMGAPPATVSWAQPPAHPVGAVPAPPAPPASGPSEPLGPPAS